MLRSVLLALFALVLVAPAARAATPDAITPLQLAQAIEARAAANWDDAH